MLESEGECMTAGSEEKKKRRKRKYIFPKNEQRANKTGYRIETIL